MPLTDIYVCTDQIHPLTAVSTITVLQAVSNLGMRAVIIRRMCGEGVC